VEKDKLNFLILQTRLKNNKMKQLVLNMVYTIDLPGHELPPVILPLFLRDVGKYYLNPDVVYEIDLGANNCSSISYSPDGKLLACAGDHTTTVRDAKTGRVLYDLEKPSSFVYFGEELLFVSNGGVYSWSEDTERCKKLIGEEEKITAVCMSPCRQYMVTGSETGLLKTRNGDMDCTCSFMWLRPIKFVSCSSDGQTLCAVIGKNVLDRETVILDTENMVMVLSWDSCPTFRFSPDCKTMAYTRGNNPVVCLYESQWDEETEISTGFQAKRTNCIAFSPDSQFLATSNWVIKIFNVQTKECTRTFYANHRMKCTDMSYSPCGRFLTCSFGEKIIVYKN
jgi:hypothetical protein